MCCGLDERRVLIGRLQMHIMFRHSLALQWHHVVLQMTKKNHRKTLFNEFSLNVLAFVSVSYLAFIEENTLME